MKKLCLTLVIAVAGCGTQQLPAVAPASPSTAVPAVYAHHLTFRFVGKPQSFKVPAGVTHIFVIAIGGSGGGHSVSRGGRVSATLPVDPGAVLTIRVGGNGSGVTGGYNGGGDGGSGGYGKTNGYGGGGATDIRQGGKSILDRVLVAGGAGGQGGSDNHAGPYSPYGSGGAGGAQTGANGQSGYPNYGDNGCYTAYIACGGGGGTPVAGGSGGPGGSGNCDGTSGSTGTLAQGGTGAETATSDPRQCGGLGGGGGGGYYGGGGGAQAGSRGGHNGFGGGGGGGGSSHVEQTATNVHMWRGWQQNEYGLVVVHW